MSCTQAKNDFYHTRKLPQRIHLTHMLYESSALQCTEQMNYGWSNEAPFRLNVIIMQSMVHIVISEKCHWNRRYGFILSADDTVDVKIPFKMNIWWKHKLERRTHQSPKRVYDVFSPLSIRIVHAAYNFSRYIGTKIIMMIRFCFDRQKH